MMKFEDLQKVNESISTMDIKGKEYAEVNQRIKAFRMLYPEGYIMTRMLSNQDGMCVFMAEVGYYVEGNTFTLGTGTAYEKENSSFINKTSYIENCETSAVGRALAMVGIGIDTSVASYEEVGNAIKNQPPSIATLQAKLKECKLEDKIDKVLEPYKVKELKELTDDQKINLDGMLTIQLKKLKEMEKESK